MDMKDLEKQLKVGKYAQEILSTIDIPVVPKFDFSSIENPLFEQNDILKNSLETLKTTTKLLVTQNEALINNNKILNDQLEVMKDQRDKAEIESRKSKKHQLISYIITFIMFLVALLGYII